MTQRLIYLLPYLTLLAFSLTLSVGAAQDAEGETPTLTNVGASAVHGELRTPEQFEEASQFTTEDDVASILRISQDPEEHAELIRRDLSLGFDKIVFHNVGLNQDYFIDWFGSEVLPLVR